MELKSDSAETISIQNLLDALINTLPLGSADNKTLIKFAITKFMCFEYALKNQSCNMHQLNESITFFLFMTILNNLFVFLSHFWDESSYMTNSLFCLYP